jgi:hypothetical protein
MTTRTNQPSLAELTDRMMKARSVDVIDGTDPEVEPHEVLNGFHTDPRTAYTDAVLPLKLLGAIDTPTALPPEWAAFTQLPSASPAVPMAAGTFPQRVRDLSALLTASDLRDLRPKASEPVNGFAALRGWVKKGKSSQPLKWLAHGVARGLGDAPESAAESDVVARNEKAASLWLSGLTDEAVAEWRAMPDGPVVAFNLGMSLLFTGQPAAAVPSLRQAAAALPDNSGWSHLAQLYLAIAQSR